MNASKRYLWGGGIVAVIVIGLIIGAVRPNKHAQAAPASVPDVQVVQVQQEDVPIIHEWIGTLDGLVDAAGAAKCNWRQQTFELFRDVVILVRDTGMRNEKELYQVRIENINWDRRTIFVPDSKTPNGVREVPMSDRVLGLLRVRCGSQKEGWVFPSKRSASGHLATIARRFREARAKAGLPNSLVLYCGRHDFGTRVLKKTGNLKLVMQAMGHVDVKTAMKYQHPELDIVRSALNDTEPVAPATGA